jgi:hypothetical protein
MDRKIKLAVSVIAFFGILSVIFLLTAKKPTTVASDATKTQTNQSTSATKNTTAQQIAGQAKKSTVSGTSSAVAESSEASKAKTRSQWQQCKDKTILAGTTLYWKIQISETIPYAKGVLNNEDAYPVRVTIKSGVSTADKINKLLVVGKLASLRGTCTDVTADGTVIFQAF